MKKKIRIIKDWLFVKTALIFCNCFITILFFIFYLTKEMKLSEIYLLFLPTMFFGVISILLYFFSLKKQKEIIIFYENKITICKQKKQYDIKWEDVQQSSLEDLFFGTDSLIMELLTALILKPFYIQIKLKFNSNIELNEIKFCLPKRYIKYVQEKVKLSL